MWYETTSNLGGHAAAKRTTGAPLCDGVIVLEDVVHYRASNLENQMPAAWRSPNLLLASHPAMHQPLHRAFGDRCGDRLLAPPVRRTIDDDIGLPAYIHMFRVHQGDASLLGPDPTFVSPDA